MSIYYPALAMVVSWIVIFVGTADPYLSIAGGLVGLLAYLYSPLPNSNGGMGMTTDAGYWGFTPEDNEVSD